MLQLSCCCSMSWFVLLLLVMVNIKWLLLVMVNVNWLTVVVKLLIVAKLLSC